MTIHSSVLKTFACMGILILVFLCGTAASGAVPQMINFQGRLTDDNGQPIMGTKSIIFRIYDDPVSSSNLLWSETQSSVYVSTGIFSVQLGSSTPISVAVFENSNAYLEIEVDASILSPRQKLVANAYSYVAETLTSGAAVYEVDIGTLNITGSRLYLMGGEGPSSTISYIERKDTGQPLNILELKLRMTGSTGSYDLFGFYGKSASFYKNETGAVLNMEGHTISNAGAVQVSSMTAGSIFYPPSGTALPTGIRAGGVYYNSSNYILYLATETTVGDESWVILGGAGQ